MPAGTGTDVWRLGRQSRFLGTHAGLMEVVEQLDAVQCGEKACTSGGALGRRAVSMPARVSSHVALRRQEYEQLASGGNVCGRGEFFLVGPVSQTRACQQSGCLQSPSLSSVCEKKSEPPNQPMQSRVGRQARPDRAVQNCAFSKRQHKMAPI